MHARSFKSPGARLRGLVSLALLASCKTSSAPQPKREPEPAQPASAPKTRAQELVKTALSPIDTDHDGNWDLLAVDWNIEPGWHIYWTNPGDSGLASKVKLDPQSTTAFEAITLPAPEKFFSAGDLIGYGYHNHTTFFAKRKSPKTALRTPIDASLSWLVCKEECLRGKTRLSLDPGQAASTWNDAQRKAYARLPKAPREIELITQPRNPAAQSKTITLNTKQGKIVEFFPRETSEVNGQVQNGGLEIKYNNPNEILKGVIGVNNGTTTTYYNVRLPLPKTKTPPT